MLRVGGRGGGGRVRGVFGIYFESRGSLCSMWSRERLAVPSG